MVTCQPSSYLPFGVIGGMGPASTVRFLDLVLGKYRTGLGAIRNSDFPQITLHTIPDSEHMAGVPNRGIVEHLIRAFTIFECAEVVFAVAPCNTVHQFLPIPGRQSNVRVLSIASAVSNARLMEGKRVLFLSTRQTQRSGIYDRVLKESHCELVFINESDQETLDNIITQTNAGGALGFLQAGLSEVIARYATGVVLLACTELSPPSPAGRLHYCG